MSQSKENRHEDMDELFQAFLTLENMEDCYTFFGDIFTVQELESFARRLHVAKLLLNGATYGQIQEQLPVSSATITRINTELQYGSGGYRLIVERMLKQQEKQNDPAAEE
ncbi:MAG: TrpR-related protein YerC/YecD [Clostridia bacterium]|nr:TrpR-related protein YerC/YecD [Clostridia bacterium]